VAAVVKWRFWSDLYELSRGGFDPFCSILPCYAL
ncbi:unnamed protein product, partial [Brassica oleracea]